MSLRPPSLLRNYDDFFSGDPAVIPATEEEPAKAQRALAIKVARETGNWAEVTVAGGQVTKFTMKPLPGHIRDVISDRLIAGAIGLHVMRQIAFRAAFVKLDDPQLSIPTTRVFEDQLGELASTDVTDYLDRIDPSIVNELGAEAIRRSADLDPKS